MNISSAFAIVIIRVIPWQQRCVLLVLLVTMIVVQ